MPGLRFSLLLTRSTQFPSFGRILYGKYPDPVEQALVNSMIQLLWDRGEANGYVYHMVRDPLPNTPAKTVLLHEAFGDHQVTNVATETEARIIGARLRTRSTRAAAATACLLGHQADPRYPWKGNALTIFDIGPLRRPAAAAPPAWARRRAGDERPARDPASTPTITDQQERRVRVLGLPQGRRRLRRPLPARASPATPRAGPGREALVAIAAAFVALVAAAPAAPPAATRSTPRAACCPGRTTTSATTATSR